MDSGAAFVIGIIIFVLYCVQLGRLNGALRDAETLHRVAVKDKENIEKVLKENEVIYDKLCNDFESGIRGLAELAADYKTIRYEISAKYLSGKSRPAYQEAARIRELRQETKKIIQEHKILTYKYEYLFKLFPDLELFVDDLSAIKELGDFSDLDELENEVDRTRHYLSKEEWSALNIDQRNQLALDRYVAGRKSKWQIGRDYEMFIGYEYETRGWNVEYCGIEQKLEDMGRDLIARKEQQIHVIQCKFWAQHKTIYEKHIAQLYGTTIQYMLATRNTKGVVPVFITNITLADSAKKFANYLGVKVIENKGLSQFPRIKCNINYEEFGGKSKIYHLPMDQQYDKTKICKEGEFYAHTVDEAVAHGFRRAKKYFGNG